MKTITVTVDDKRVAAVIAALEGDFTDLHVRDAEAKANGERHRTRHGPSKSRTQDAIMLLARNRPSGFELKDAIDAMAANGFSPNSASPALSALVHVGRLTVGSDGLYRGAS